MSALLRLRTIASASVINVLTPVRSRNAMSGAKVHAMTIWLP